MPKLKKCDCLICRFENPKPTATAVIIKDQKLLVAKRTLKNEPFYGEWDFLGGYLQKNESPEEALKRELKEELGVDSKSTFIGNFTGTSFYREYKFSVMTSAYLTDITGNLKLNKKENSKLKWVSINRLKTIAFDSNQKILKYIKKKFVYDLKRVKKLIHQLDPSANVNEQSLYNALLNGHVSKVEKDGKLVGMGWIFPRQTLLRKQAVVEDMIVDNRERGKGYGRRILRDLINWAKNSGVEVVELTTNPKRVAANELYKSEGFWLHETNHYLLELK